MHESREGNTRIFHRREHPVDHVYHTIATNKATVYGLFGHTHRYLGIIDDGRELGWNGIGEGAEHVYIEQF